MKKKPRPSQVLCSNCQSNKTRHSTSSKDKSIWFCENCKQYFNILNGSHNKNIKEVK